MTLKLDATFEVKVICCFKTDKNLVNFDPITQKSFGKYLPVHLKVGAQNWDFYRVLLSQVENV